MTEEIMKKFPAAFAQWEAQPLKATLNRGTTYDFLDSKEIVVTVTFEPDFERPFGYEVRTKTRFIREQANYLTRGGAEQAGIEQGFSELNKLILKGNA